jgi:hypothetical protein
MENTHNNNQHIELESVDERSTLGNQSNSVNSCCFQFPPITIFNLIWNEKKKYYNNLNIEENLVIFGDENPPKSS